MKNKIEAILHTFPEVHWDRWAGGYHALEVFGWIPRADGQRDFLTLRIIDGTVVNLVTSSAKFSEIFSARMDFTHTNCRRVADWFTVLNAVR